MKPSDNSIVDFKMILPSIMRNSNGIEDRVLAWFFFQSDPCSNGNCFSWFCLEKITFEQNITLHRRAAWLHVKSLSEYFKISPPREKSPLLSYPDLSMITRIVPAFDFDSGLVSKFR